ncbi:MAG: hypothetical protein RLZZ124_1354 [Cyanobacteriota bacterium]|jgi:hypothetical protein
MTEPTINLIETHATGVVMIRYVVKEDGKDDEYIRSSFEPGQDVSDQPQEIQDACAAAWTPEVLASWQQRLNQPAAPLEP